MRGREGAFIIHWAVCFEREYLLQSASTATLKLQNHKKLHVEKLSRPTSFEIVGHHYLLEEIPKELGNLQNQLRPKHPYDSVQ